MTKEKLRTLYLERRVTISGQLCSLLSHNLYERFISYFDASTIRVLHSYLPMEKNREPDTWIIIDWFRMKYPEIRISLPRVNFETGELDSVYFDDRYQLQKNKWGLEEPHLGVPTPPGVIDLVIVPLLAVDKRGHRVGYGKGYYDKFLSTCRPDCKKVGLSFFEPVDAIKDINALDIPLNYCITPQSIHTF